MNRFVSALCLLLAAVTGCAGSSDNQEDAVNLGAITGTAAKVQLTLSKDLPQRHLQFDASGAFQFRVTVALTEGSRLPVWNYLQAHPGDVATCNVTHQVKNNNTGATMLYAQAQVFDNRVYIQDGRLLEDNNSQPVVSVETYEVLTFNNLYPGDEALTYDVTVAAWK
jgi:hypothetical protein